MRGGGGGAGPAFGPAPFLLGGVGAAKGLLPCFLVPTRNQPTACTLALWWLKFGPTEDAGGGGGTREARFGGGVPGTSFPVALQNAKSLGTCTKVLCKGLKRGIWGLTMIRFKGTRGVLRNAAREGAPVLSEQSMRARAVEGRAGGG